MIAKQQRAQSNITKQEPKREKKTNGRNIKQCINNNIMTVRKVALTKYPCIVEACLEGVSWERVTMSLEINRHVSLMNWQISPFFSSKYPISLTVRTILNAVSHYGISVDVKWIGYPISQEDI